MTKLTKSNISNHPAVKLGNFIKNQRIGAALTLCQLARKMRVKPSILSELERGIGDHLTAFRYNKIQEACRVDCETWKFEKLVMETQKSSILDLCDLCTKSDLMPAFPSPKIWTKSKIKKFDAMLDKMLERKLTNKKRRIIMD